MTVILKVSLHNRIIYFIAWFILSDCSGINKYIPYLYVTVGFLVGYGAFFLIFTAPHCTISSLNFQKFPGEGSPIARIVSHRISSYRIVSSRIVRIVSYPIVYRIISYLIVSYRFVPCRVVSYIRIVSYRVASYRIETFHIVSCRVVSCRVVSCRVVSCPI